MSQGYRFEPATVRHERVLRRSRLTRLLNGRFSHLVTTVERVTDAIWSAAPDDLADADLPLSPPTSRLVDQLT